MILPDYVENCIVLLEKAGFAAYCVGGCVRDALLGLEPHDYDLCTSALPEQMQQVFSGFSLVLAGVKHGTVGVITPEGVVEITTFRCEGDYADHRHPGWVAFVPEIEKDLARRDFTVNAMAYSPIRGFADPFGGREDLDRRVLRAVGVPERRFREDALRILRGMRFCAAYGLTPEAGTRQAMLDALPLLDTLARERVFGELTRFLTAADFSHLMTFAPELAAAIPELGQTMGFDQHSPHHAYDVYTHIAHVTAGVSAHPVLRWAALLHDVGKPGTFTQDADGRGHFYGHASRGAELADAILGRLRAPGELRREAVLLIGAHMNRLTPDRPLLRKALNRYGPERVRQLLLLQRVDMGSKGVPGEDHPELFRETEALLEQLMRENACLSLKDLAVKGGDLIPLGYQGPRLGRCLARLLEAVVEERLPNERTALLEAAGSGLGE